MACPSFPDCGGQWLPRRSAGPAWQGFATLAVVPPAGDAAAVTLHLLHRWGALAALLLLLLLLRCGTLLTAPRASWP
nr:hypothetical protein [Candidatus Accumulibacter sp. ACC003]